MILLEDVQTDLGLRCPNISKDTFRMALPTWQMFHKFLLP